MDPFLAVQDSSIGDLVTHSLTQSVTHLLILASLEQCRAMKNDKNRSKFHSKTALFAIFLPWQVMAPKKVFYSNFVPENQATSSYFDQLS